MYRLARSILFRLDPETAHELVTRQMMHAQRSPMFLDLVRRLARPPAMPRRVWGIDFENPIGIAAGFDKNAELLPMLDALGFGFLEVGTITLWPQPGNPQPRMFRFPQSRALINRLGFNNDGAFAAAERLGAWREAVLCHTARAVPLFANIGKNRDVPLDAAPENYVRCFDLVAPLSDAVVVNVSSPNTAGLRDLQRPEHLSAILRVLRERREAARFSTLGEHPILVKIAPDLDEGQLRETADVCRTLADGMTATNTTISREGVVEKTGERGGLSGRPLFSLSTEILRRLRAIVGPDYPLIGVGGVFTRADVDAKLAAGANLVQLYTGFIYEGPLVVKKLVS